MDFMTVIYSGVDYFFASEFKGDERETERLRNYMSDQLAEFVKERKRIIKTFYLDKDEPDLRRFNLNSRKYHPTNFYESGSHVVHVPFDEEDTRKAIRKLEELTGARYCD